MNNEKDTGIEVLMARLEEITSQMEKESLPLADMMALYKEGRTLEKKIRTLLDLTEKEIEILSADEAEDGEEQL
ncbi:MAG: exodeoxyribonuclease VII small subunit [Firmicutes bacterium]|nr:exodeoxyribonuclease VII small subunit [Bacillota bacterium]